MRRSLLRGVLFVTLAAVATACGSEPTTPTPQPQPTPVTETFTGTVTVNGAVTIPFPVSQQGNASATIVSLQPRLTLRLEEGGSGTFVVGETVYLGEPDDTTATGVVRTWQPNTRTLTVSDISGAFTTESVLTGTDSRATWTIAGVDSTVVGLALGTFSGTTCAIVLANDNASVGGLVIGTVQASGMLCARIYDVGRLEGPASFTIEVTHF